MNFATYQTYLTPQFQSHLPKSLSEGAEALATAYHLANIGQSTTPFGAPLMNADKNILKFFIELGLTINFYGGQIQSVISGVLGTIRGAIKSFESGNPPNVEALSASVNSIMDGLISSLPAPLAFIGPIVKKLLKGIFDDLVKSLANKMKSSPKDALKCTKKLEGIMDLLDVSKIAYTVMATGYCLYWLTATMSPVPPMPPCLGPTGGTIILIPGLPIPLNSDFGKTFKKGNSVPEVISKLYNNLVQHQLLIIGVYLGIIPFVPSPIPGPPIPWFSMLNVPFPDIKKSEIAGGEKRKEEDKSKKEVDPTGIKAGEKLKKGVAGLKKQSEDLKSC